MSTLTTPNTVAATASPVRYEPSANPAARLSTLSATALTSTRPVPHAPRPAGTPPAPEP